MDYYSYILNKRGYTLVHKKDGDEAFQGAADEKYDAVVLDIMMPPRNHYGEMDTHDGLHTGRFVYLDLRKHQGTIPIIVLTNLRHPDPHSLFPVNSDANLFICQKEDTPPRALADIVAKAIRQYVNSVETTEPEVISNKISNDVG